MEKTNRSASLVTLLVAAIVIVIAIWTIFEVKSWIPSRGYHAVFLSNNQVYFGKLSHKNNDFLRLSDIYYLQLTAPLQNQREVASGQPDLTLIKLGNELHGPEDEMRINRGQVIFLEELKKDSKVVTAIENYQASQAQ